MKSSHTPKKQKHGTLLIIFGMIIAAAAMSVTLSSCAVTYTPSCPTYAGTGLSHPKYK